MGGWSWGGIGALAALYLGLGFRVVRKTHNAVQKSRCAQEPYYYSNSGKKYRSAVTTVRIKSPLKWIMKTCHTGYQVSEYIPSMRQLQTAFNTAGFELILFGRATQFPFIRRNSPYGFFDLDTSRNLFVQFAVCSWVHQLFSRRHAGVAAPIRHLGSEKEPGPTELVSPQRLIQS